MSSLPLALRVQSAAVRKVMQLPHPWLLRLAGGTPRTRDGYTLDAQLQLLVYLAARTGNELSAKPGLSAKRLAMEHEAPLFSQASPALEAVRDEQIGTFSVRIYRPVNLGINAPALVFFHGGGFACGSIDSHHPVCCAMANDARCVVISVEYRRAPEHPFPAAPDDATAAFRWVIQEAERLGIDPHRVAVAGDSAGGNLATVVCIDTRDDLVRPCLQVLIYPVVDQAQTFPSARTMDDGYLLDRATIVWFREQYLSKPEDLDHPRASPWRADNLTGLPPAHVQIAGFDPLRDEGEAYANKLMAAGVTTELKRYTSLTHGYLNMVGLIDAAQTPWTDMIAALRSQFAATTNSRE
jgi:acetyl esterase